jgi:hypothetical protein
MIFQMQKESKGIATASSLEELRTSAITRHLHRWLPFLRQALKEDSSDQDRHIILRFAAGIRVLPVPPPSWSITAEQLLKDFGPEAQLTLKVWDQMLIAGNGAIQTEERCAACATKLSLAWNSDTASFDWAKCENSHVWRKCKRDLGKRIAAE